MEKIEEVKIESTQKVHKFHCDKCNKYLGEYIETGDDEHDVFEKFSFSMTDKYTLVGHLCNKCREEFFEKLTDFLAETGVDEFGLDIIKF